MLQPEKCALILIDVQGKLASLMTGKKELFHHLRILIQGVQILEMPIFWLEQYPQGLGPTIPEVAELLGDHSPVPKVSFSAWGEKKFVDELRASGRRQVLLAGIEAHVCVCQTARDLLEEQYHVEVVIDAISSRTLENKKIGVDKMRNWGAEVTSVETALFELLQGAGSPHFKEISRLVR